MTRRTLLTRAELIDSLAAVYGSTRLWSQAAHDQHPTAQAIAYGSRRNDSGRCVMLFGQRLPPSPLTFGHLERVVDFNAEL